MPLEGVGGGTVEFARWPHLMAFALALTRHRLISILKARQVGFSWLIAAYVAWLILFREGSVVLMLSRGQEEAKSLLKKVKDVHRSLPATWQRGVGADSGKEYTIPDMRSKVLALPSTEDAGRSETATLVVQDEADFHEYLDTNYLAVKPTIDAGGQMIMGSTANKRSQTSLFKSNYKDAPQNGWHSVFWGWNARPNRTVAWYDLMRREAASLSYRVGLTPDAYMEQEYPRTAEEALSPSRSIAAFDHDILTAMVEQTREPIIKMDNISIWTRWRPEGRYVAGTDTSHGVESDYAVTCILETRSGAVVADIMDNTLEPETLAYDSIRMLKLYHNPIWAIEDNEWGILTIKAAQAQHYPRIYARQTAGNVRVPGWHTDGKSRWEMWGELMESFNAGQFILYNRAAVQQFFSVIKDAARQGKPIAMQGANDDYPTALGIAYQMRKFAAAHSKRRVVRGALF